MDNRDVGFVSIAQAIKLISKHTMADPTVDLLYLIDNLNRVRRGRNYTIYRAEKDKSGKTVRVYPPITTTVANEEDMVDLKRAIRNKFEQVTGKKFVDIASIGLRKVTNVVDDQYGTTARFRKNVDSKIKLGDTISSGTTFNSNKI